MSLPKASEEEFISLYRELQSAGEVAKRLGMARTTVQRRRRFLEMKHGISLPQYDTRPRYNSAAIDQKAVATYKIKNGRILIGSDIHLWPGPLTACQRAFLIFAKEFKPDGVVVNGDVFDGASIARWPSIGWEKKPTVQEELEAVEDYLHRLYIASPNSSHFWPAGNHDLRFESRLAAAAPEYKGIKGIHLKDHIQGWTPCWRIDVNEDVVIKHRFKSGIHAPHNNTLWAGKTIITGHLHSLKVMPISDYNGTRWGVDTGCLADPYSEPFINYTEASPVSWRAGFVLLTFRNGRLLWPEIIHKWDDDHVEFRGEIIGV